MTMTVPAGRRLRLCGQLRRVELLARIPWSGPDVRWCLRCEVNTQLFLPVATLGPSGVELDGLDDYLPDSTASERAALVRRCERIVADKDLLASAIEVAAHERVRWLTVEVQHRVGADLLKAELQLVVAKAWLDYPSPCVATFVRSLSAGWTGDARQLVDAAENFADDDQSGTGDV